MRKKRLQRKHPSSNQFFLLKKKPEVLWTAGFFLRNCTVYKFWGCLLLLKICKFFRGQVCSLPLSNLLHRHSA
jgi:hypothetical protein